MMRMGLAALTAAGVLMASGSASADVTVVTADASELSHYWFSLPDDLLSLGQTIYFKIDYSGISDLSSLEVIWDYTADVYVGGGDPYDPNNYATGLNIYDACDSSNCLEVIGNQYFGAITAPQPCGDTYEYLCIADRPSHYQEVDFDASAISPDATMTITFSSERLTAPEPSTWMLMIVGLGSIGGTLRRRRCVLERDDHRLI